MEIKRIISLEPTLENHFAMIDKKIPKAAGVYLLFDKDEDGRRVYSWSYCVQMFQMWRE